MKWYNVVILGLLILGFIFVLGYQLGINANKDEQVYQSKIDSLKSALKSQIEVYNFKLDSLNKDIDSLDKVKNKIIIKYKCVSIVTNYFNRCYLLSVIRRTLDFDHIIFCN